MSEALAPVVNDLNRPFWAGAAEGRLLLPRCETTGRLFWPPSAVSPFVTGGSVSWAGPPGDGLLVAAVVYRRVFQKAFEPLAPYGIGLVQLEEGPRLQVFLGPPEGFSVGERVRVGFAEILSGHVAPIALKVEARGD